MIGKNFAHYNIVGKLGEGGMGSVWLAEDTLLDRKVALKFLSDDHESDETARRRFLREARAAAALDHPFVCKIYEAGEEEGKAYIAMEYAEGKPLDQRLAESGPIPINEVVKISSEIAEAMEAAHRRQIVHRDLKPANIMITADGHLKILDFGLAKQLPIDLEKDHREQETALTAEGVVQGTMGYMSPEQLRGQEVDTRSDIFSFGVVMYEMLAGVTPFKRVTTADSINAIVHESPPPLARYREDVPDVLEHAVRKMLAKSVRDRYQTAHEVRTDLRQLVADETRYFEAAEHAPRKSGKKWVVSAGVFSLALIGSLTLAWFFGGKPKLSLVSGSAARVETLEMPRLAVLPFENRGREPGDEAFSDGLTETMITHLHRLHGLKVISRRSVMIFKERERMKNSEIAEQLNANYMVDGSLRRVGDRGVVSVQLIRVVDDSELWAEEFSEPWSSLFKLRGRITQRVVESIDVALRPADRQALAGDPTHLSTIAFEAHNRGLFSASKYRNEGKLEDFEHAQKFFQDALEADPQYLDVQVDLGLLYTDRYFLGKDDGTMWRDKSESVLRDVLDKDPNQAEAISRLGWIMFYKGDIHAWYEKAIRAIEISPNYGLAHNSLASFFWHKGYYESALFEYGISIELDPLRWELLRNRALALAALGRYEEALHSLKEANRIWPKNTSISLYVAEIQIQCGQFEEAQAILDARRDLAEKGEKSEIEILDATVAALRGDPAPGRKTLARHVSPPSRYVLPLLRLAGTVGNAEDAIRVIRNTNRKPSYRELLDPMILPLHADPDFQDVLEERFKIWEEDLFRYGPALPLIPKILPLPERLASMVKVLSRPRFGSGEVKSGRSTQPRDG